MILKIKRTRYSSVDHRSTVYASEINAEINSGFARYQSQDDEHITVLKD